MTKNEKNEKRKHYLVYQIEDNLNKKIYIGVHSTLKINDGYMGSGTGLKKAISEYGIENFSKTIIYDFNNKDEMLNKEAEIVNEEFIKRNDTYNIILGGGFNTSGLATVKDKEGNVFDVSVDDERYLSGELVGVTKGLITTKNTHNHIIKMSISDERFLNGEYVGITKGFIPVKDENGNMFNVSVNDERYLNGELKHICKDLVTVKNKNGETLKVSVDDERYLNGELNFIWKDKKHTKETLKKMREIHQKNEHQQGEKNSQYGTCWIMNKKLKENKKIKKDDLDEWLKKGWFKGRKIK